MKRLALLLCFAAATIGSLAANPVTVTFTGANGQVDANGSGYYISPYSGTINGASVTLYCDDDANEVSNGQTWQANLTSLTSGNLSNTRYGGATNALTLYDEVAWLTTQYAYPLNSSTDQRNSDIQDTIWNIFNPGKAPTPSNGSYWLTQAQNNYASISYSNFFIVTNVGPVQPTGQVQEFITVLTPEPSSMLMLGCGLIALSVFARKFIRREQTSRS